MRVGLLTREYPPEVYGGAGVHVEYLARELRAFEDVRVHCWGAPRPDASAYRAWDELAGDIGMDVIVAFATDQQDRSIPQQRQPAFQDDVGPLTQNSVNSSTGSPFIKVAIIGVRRPASFNLSTKMCPCAAIVLTRTLESPAIREA